jgi:uncharacterized membrane protein YsdA (DUF1294 family)
MFHIQFDLSYLEAYILFISIFSFFLYGYDKIKAIQNNKNISRISEKALLFSSLLGGTIGSLFAMVLFRHKIKKFSFLIKYIFVVAIQVIFIYLYLTPQYSISKFF